MCCGSNADPLPGCHEALIQLMTEKHTTCLLYIFSSSVHIINTQELENEGRQLILTLQPVKRNFICNRKAYKPHLFVWYPLEDTRLTISRNSIGHGRFTGFTASCFSLASHILPMVRCIQVRGRSPRFKIRSASVNTPVSFGCDIREVMPVIAAQKTFPNGLSVFAVITALSMEHFCRVQSWPLDRMLL